MRKENVHTKRKKRREIVEQTEGDRDRRRRGIFAYLEIPALEK